MSDSRDDKNYGDFRAFQDDETPRDDVSPTPQNPQTDESAPPAESTQTAETAPTAESTQTIESVPPAESTQTSQNAPPSARRDEPGVFAQILFYSVKYGLILAIFGGGGLCRLATKDSDRYDRVDRSPVPRIADVPPKRTERDASSTSENAPSAPSVPDDLPERLEIARRLSAPIVDGKPDVDAIRNGVLRRLIVEKGDEAPRWSSRGLKLRAPQDANWNDDAERPGGTPNANALRPPRLEPRRRASFPLDSRRRLPLRVAARRVRPRRVGSCSTSNDGRARFLAP